MTAAHGPSASRLGLLLLTLAFLALPLAAGQGPGLDGLDPGRTGALSFEGPATNDTAFQVRLPGAAVAQTVVHEGHAYIATTEATFWREDLNTSALWRIDLTSGDVEKLMDIPEGHLAYLVTPTFVILDETGDDQGIVAMDVATGERMWKVRPFQDVALPDRDPDDVALVDGTVYVSLLLTQGGVSLEGFNTGSYERGGVVAIDLATGETLWEWARSETAAQGADLALPGAGPAGMMHVDSIEVSAGFGRVFVYTKLGEQGGVDDSRFRVTEYELWGLDGATGATLWKTNDTRRESVRPDPVTGLPTAGDELIGAYVGGSPAVTELAVLVRLDRFAALNPATGEVLWSAEAGSSDQVKTQGINSQGVRGGVYIGTSRQTLYRMDAGDGDLVWQRTDPNRTKGYTVIPVRLDAQRAYAPISFTGPEGKGLGLGIEAVDLATGARLWTWEHVQEVGPRSAFSNRPGFGPGVMAWSGFDGIVHVVGETPASLGPPEVDEEMYPQPGERVEVDLSGSAPGAFGPATRYRVTWGDGTVTPWQTSPRFEHVYQEVGTRTARFQVGNDANQTASTFSTMYVGGSEPTFLETAFQRENQDLTFGVLGIATALGGGIIAVGRRRRQRSRLQRELDAVEATYEQHKAQPLTCEAELRTCRARAHDLLVAGKLDEGQARVLEGRVDELLGQLRATLLDERFQFLPHGLVLRLQEMLADGRISAWEREHILQALDADQALNEAQREEVRALIEGWFDQDR